MTHVSRARTQKREDNRRRQKLFGGKYTAEEVHSALAFPKGTRCEACGAPPLTRCIIMAEESEALKSTAVELMRLAAPALYLQSIVKIKGSDGRPRNYFRISTTYACKRCTPAMERVAARAPSHAIVEWNYGPSADKIITTG